MARLNIEDRLFKDSRFLKLVILFQDDSKAIGELIKAWCVAQEYFLTHEEIPLGQWEQRNLNNKIIECGLAYKTKTGVKMRGQIEQFSWLRQRSNAGKKNRKKRGTERPTSNDSRETSSFSSSFSYSKNKEINTIAQNKENFERELENIYLNYPKKIGKKNGFKVLAKSIKTKDQLSALNKAVKNYSDYVKDKNKQYIKQFDTFANCWQDWVDFAEENKKPIDLGGDY